MKRTLALALCAVMAAGMFAGCSSSKPTDTSSQGTGSTAGNASQEKTEVVFWTSMSGGMGETVDEIVKTYNESQDKVHVSVEFQGNYYDMAAKLQTAVTSGEIPHIAQLEMGRTKMFADYGILQDMTEPAKEAGLDTTMFYDGLMTSCDWGEGLYALPFNRSTPMFYYNKDMFREVGLDPETPPATWEDLKTYAEKLSIADQRWGFEMPIDAWFYEAFIMQSGGNILNEDETDIAFNNEKGTDPLHLWKDMVHEGWMKTPPGKEYNSYEAARSDFSAGITGMIICSSGDLGTLTSSCNFDLGTAFLPKNDRFGVPTGGANVVMMTGHEEDTAATMDFLKYLTSPDVAGLWSSKTGYVPSSAAAAESQVYKEFLASNANAGTALAQMEFTDIPRPVNENYPQIHAEIMMTEIQRCMEEDNYTPEQAVQAISDQTKKLLG